MNDEIKQRHPVGIPKLAADGVLGTEAGCPSTPIASYIDGIRRAERQGRILYSDQKYQDALGPRDDYGHLPAKDPSLAGLRCTNTRPLPDIAKAILGLYQVRPHFRFLEMGPGAGISCSTVSRLMPQARIDTVSLTPINPYLRFLADDVSVLLDGLIARMERSRNLSRRLSNELQQAQRLKSVPPNLLLDLQHHLGLQLFEELSTPFISEQHIGSFPAETNLAPRSYHMLYDYYGALFYNSEEGREYPLSRSTEDSIQTALTLLRADGVLLIMATGASNRIEDAFRDQTESTDTIVACRKSETYRDWPCLVAKSESPLTQRIWTAARSWSDRDGNMIWMPEDKFERIIMDCVT